MKFISSDLVSSICRRANSQYFAFIESVIYLMSSFLIICLTAIGSHHLSLLVPKVGKPDEFMKICLATTVSLLSLYYPVFISRGKKKNQKIIQEAEEELESLVEVLDQNDVKTTVDLLKEGYLKKDVSFSSEEEFGKRVYSDYNKFYFKDILGKYRILKEKISEIYSETSYQTRYFVYLLDENDCDKQDKRVIKKLKKH